MSAAALLAGALLTPADGAPLLYATAPGSRGNGWTQPVLVMREGDSVTFANLDTDVHDVVSLVHGPDEPFCEGRFEPGECPLVFSERIGLGERTPVLGLENVRSGWQIPFTCTLHPNMRGTLVVL